MNAADRGLRDSIAFASTLGLFGESMILEFYANPLQHNAAREWIRFHWHPQICSANY